MIDNSFSRLQLLIGEDLIKLQNSCVVIVGLGGVGSYAVETLSRSGIGKLIIIDKDIFEASNLNRQLYATSATLEKNKVDIAYDRIKDINPNLKVVKHFCFLEPDNINELLDYEKIDFIIDACDTMTTKLAIIKYALYNKIDFIISLGAANKFDATKVQVVDLKDTYNDGVAKALRMLVKKEKIHSKIMCAFSDELVRKDLVKQNQKFQTDSLLGSNAFVPSVFGIVCANYCFRRLLENKY